MLSPCWGIIFDILIIHSILSPKCQFAQSCICILCDICFRNLRVNDLSDHRADHSYLTYQINMVTNCPLLGVCNYLSILHYKDNNVSVSVFSQGCVCGWPGTTVPEHLLPLRWPVFHVDMMVVVSRKLCIHCCFHFCWLYTRKAVVLKGCLWDGCLWCLRYIIGDLVSYLFLKYGLIEMFSVSIHRKLCALI